jgi:hypothetical protein
MSKAAATFSPPKAASTGARVGGFRSLSLAQRSLLIAGLLVLVIGLFYAEENWRGRHAWETCRRELEAKGVQLDWQKFVPPPAPDEQNFAMTPFLAPLFDFNPKEPGPRRWRDTEGHDRAVNFAAALLPMDKKGRIPPARFDGKMTDLEGSLRLLRNQTNGVATSVPAFSTRAQAATAVLAALEEHKPVLEELRAASRRPHSRFNIEYDAQDPMSILLPHYLVLQHVCRALEIRASAELALGKSEAALEDTGLMYYLANSIQVEPFLMGMIARGSLAKQTEQIIWEGLAGQNWSDPQLREFQKDLKGFAALKSLETGLRSERAAFGDTAFRFIRVHKNVLRNWIGSEDAASALIYLLAGPNGWLYQEQVTFHRLYDQRITPGFDSQAGRFQPRTIDDNRRALARDLEGSSFWHHTGFSRLMLRDLTKTFQRAAIGQNRADQAVIACALERYRLANGKYPETLDALVPQFTDRVPLDVCDGQPLKYRLLQDGQFLLYGAGWNEKDDGGLVVMKQDGSDIEPDQGDWVWPPYPEK